MMNQIDIYENWNDRSIVTDRMVRAFKRNMDSSEYDFSPIDDDYLKSKISEEINNINSIMEYRRVGIYSNILNFIIDNDLICWVCTSKVDGSKKIAISKRNGYPVVKSLVKLNI